MTPHPSGTLPVRKCTFVLHHRPNFLIRQEASKGNHARSRRTVFDHPKDFPFSPVSPETMRTENTRRWIEARGTRPIPSTIHTMAIDASAFTLIDIFPLFNDSQRLWQWAGQSSRFIELLCWDTTLHHMLTGPKSRTYEYYTQENTQSHHLPKQHYFALLFIIEALEFVTTISQMKSFRQFTLYSSLLIGYLCLFSPP
jgi:hypothetical protein